VPNQTPTGRETEVLTGLGDGLLAHEAGLTSR
jgi:hypothetical protein